MIEGFHIKMKKKRTSKDGLFGYTYHSYTHIQYCNWRQKGQGRKCRMSLDQFNCSVMSDSLWLPWTAACQASVPITNSQSLLKLMSIQPVMPSNHPILCYPLLLLPSVSPSIRVFSNGSLLQIRWPKYWSFSFRISPSYKYSGLIPFRADWFDLLAVQGTFKCLLQHHSSKESILQCLSFMVRLSHLYKTIVLMIQTFVGKVMSVF